MGLIEQIRKNAREEVKTILLPEPTDPRVLTAAEILKRENLVIPVLLGNEQEIKKIAQEENISIGSSEESRSELKLVKKR